MQVFHPVPEDAVQGQVRGRDLLQPAGQGRDAEETGANTETDKQFIYNTYTELLKKASKPSRA